MTNQASFIVSAVIIVIYLNLQIQNLVRTVLSSPSVIIITKKMIEKKVEPVMFAMASGYVMKSKLGPESGKILIMKRTSGEAWHFFSSF